MAEALYRKYRPQVFEDVVGQEPIERTLKNAIASDKVSHAYLFCGPRGTGKTTTARLLSKALLCERGPTPDPDGTCEDCQLIAEGTHPDVYELDAASRTGVDNVREEIISRVHFAPTRGRSKVYIIDEVHMLSTAAFNALLKTLEEPPAHVVFILCTTDPQKVPDTILSRCQRFDFHRIAPESMVARLGAICMAEEVEFEGEALDLIAQRAAGGLRDALTSLEQIIAFEGGRVTLAGAERLLGSIDSSDLAEIMGYIGRRDVANCFRWTAGYVETGADLAQFTRDMAEHVRNLYVLALVGDDAQLDVSETSRAQLVGELSWFGPDRAARMLGVLGDLSAELKTTSNARLAFEIALTRLVRPDSDLTLEALAERVEALESGYSAVAHVLPGPVAAAPAQGEGAAPAAATAVATTPAAAPSTGAPATAGAAAGVPAAGAPAAEPAAGVPAAGSVAGIPTAESVAGIPVGTPLRASAVPAGADARMGTPTEAGVNNNDPNTLAATTAGARSGVALDNPATLQRVWQAALAEVKRQKQAYGVLFMNTKAIFDEQADMVKVRFEPDATFAFNAVQKPDAQDILATALEKSAGAPVRFCYVLGDADPTPSPRIAQTPQPASEPEPQPAPQAAQPEPTPQAVQPGPATEPEPQPEPATEPEPQPEPAPQAMQPEPTPQPEPQPAPATQVEQAPAYDDVPPYDDYVPYDDMPPYDDYDAPAAAPVNAPAQPQPQPQPEPQPVPAPDATAAPSPAEPALDANGAPVEDPAAVQALLQASFGASVVLSETDD